LIRACHAQFDQIFGIYDDPENIIINTLKMARPKEPMVHFSLKDGSEHAVYLIKDPDTLNSVHKEFLYKKILIADGHHRYETARVYRNIMRTRYYPMSSNRAYEYTLMYLTNMENEGLLILATHRLLTTAPITRLDEILKRIENHFEIRVLFDSDLDMAMKELWAAGEQTPSFLFRHKDSEVGYLLKARPESLATIGEDLDPSLRSLDVVVVSRLLFQRVLGFRVGDMDRDDVFHYSSDPHFAYNAPKRPEYIMSVLVNPTKIEQVKEVAQRGLVMPRKSTFFYPKVLSGLVMHKIDPYEIAYVPEAEP
jgi:uncharacterized protein (DUF1015 family)